MTGAYLNSPSNFKQNKSALTVNKTDFEGIHLVDTSICYILPQGFYENSNARIYNSLKHNELRNF